MERTIAISPVTGNSFLEKHGLGAKKHLSPEKILEDLASRTC